MVPDTPGVFLGPHYNDIDLRSNNQCSNADFLKLRPRRSGELHGGFYLVLSNSFAEYFLIVAKTGAPEQIVTILSHSPTEFVKKKSYEPCFMNSLLSHHRWISGTITQTFKRMICVTALYKGSLPQKTTHLSLVYRNAVHETVNKRQRSCSWDGTHGLVGPVAASPVVPQQEGHGFSCAAAAQADGRKVMVCGSPMTSLISHCPAILIIETT